MTIDEYTKSIKEIENFYGKEYTDFQKKEMFNRLKAIKIERFRYIISQLYATLKFLPKLPDILEINTSVGQQSKPNLEPEKKCSKCKGTGYITYWKKIKNGDKEMNYEYMAVCDCGKQKQYKGWEISDERYRSNYYTPFVTEIGL